MAELSNHEIKTSVNYSISLIKFSTSESFRVRKSTERWKLLWAMMEEKKKKEMAIALRKIRKFFVLTAGKNLCIQGISFNTDESSTKEFDTTVKTAITPTLDSTI